MHHANCKHRCGARFLKIGLLVLVGIAVLSYVVMLLWNAIMPHLIDGAHTLSYLQAVGLLILSKILFGGHHRMHHHRRCHHQRWHHMSEEERAKFRAGKGGCGCGKCEDSSEAVTETVQE